MSEYPFPKEFVEPLINDLHGLYTQDQTQGKPIVDISVIKKGSDYDPWAVITGPSGINIGAAKASIKYIEQDMLSKIDSTVDAGKDIFKQTTESAVELALGAAKKTSAFIAGIPRIIKPLIICSGWSATPPIP